MYMRLVSAVRTRSKNCSETMACAFTQLVAKILCHGRVREHHDPAVCQYERAQIDRITLAVLAKFGAGHTIATTALVRVIGFDSTQRRAQLFRPRCRFVSKPRGDGFRQTYTAEPAPV